MNQNPSASSGRTALLLVGFLVAIGVGMLIGWASFGAGGADPSAGDEELACAGLEQLEDHDDFESIAEEGIGPDVFRAIGAGHYAMAMGESGDPWYDAGNDLVRGATALDPEKGNEGLEGLRELCD